MFIPRRNKVVKSKIAGKEVNINALSIYKDTNKTTKETVIFNAKNISRSGVGSGISITVKIPISAVGMASCFNVALRLLLV